nr:membrane protein insertion efficiency factor YidD [Spirochaeta cellobiosiphila]
MHLYQSYISSQDRPSCVFSPTCSEYTRQAIQLYGPVKGSLMGAERLLRCHKYQVSPYKVDSEGHYLDPLPLPGRTK